MMKCISEDIKNKALKFNNDNYKSLIDGVFSLDDLSIYNGKSGVILYLIELHEISGSGEVLSKIIEVSNDLLTFDMNVHVSTPITFLTGSIGIAYTLAKIYELTKIRSYELKCIEIITQSLNHLRRKDDAPCEYLNGHAGLIVGLLKIKSIVNHGVILEFISFSVDHLVNNAEMDSNGNLFWDYSIKNNKGLTGFSHGVSGIAYAFLSLYKVTSNKSFLQIYRRGINYEDTHFDNSLCNWIDYRKFPNDLNEEAIFIREASEGNEAFFTMKKQMVAWCHGAPGVLMTRFQDQKQFYPIQYYKSLILSDHILMKPSKFSLCHGDIGNFICLLNSKLFNDEINVEEVTIQIDKIIERFNVTKKDFSAYNKENKIQKQSLFLGQLGTLYSTLILLKYKSKSNNENILLPVIEYSESLLDVKYTFTTNYMKIIKINNYPKTYRIATSLNEQNNVLNRKEGAIRSTLDLERKILKFRDDLPSASYIYFRANYHVKKYKQYLAENNYEFKLVLSNNFLKIYHEGNISSVSEENSKVFFLALSHHSIKSIIVNDFLSLIINYISNPISFKLLLKTLESCIEQNSSPELVFKVVTDTIEKLIELSVVEVP
ncbi:lanthionine synthetase LanC family protein [Chryseobacterium wangxinyae]|uniref:lanthionine synthetase LanC family protein n=1 Tax=Chryseobacterium sp. CY353 TaxID=2997334 RepID=UPI002271ECA9|nr:lanthionine synthetase LanC family protein [Chryseobacterium sp. CY353]MCY0971129.1 hypothetical protein [Chryseobacterium sp. CY353]